MAPYYSQTGRPSIDPELILRMLILGYVLAIRSERQICAEVQVNLAYRWFCRLTIEEAIPNHSVFSRARHERFRESDVLHHVFERIVGASIAAGLVGADGFSIDASLIAAGVNKKKRTEVDADVSWPLEQEAFRAVREYLDTLNAAADGSSNHNQDDPGDVDGKPTSKPGRRMSFTDPQSRWIARKGMTSAFYYSANYLIDNRFGIIADAEGTRANRAIETAATETMLTRVMHRLAGDTAYGTGHLLKWLVERNITPHVPVVDHSKYKQGMFSKADFTFDHDKDIYICPAGREPTHSGLIVKGDLKPYRASAFYCARCDLKHRCTTGKARKVSRHINEDVRDYVRSLKSTEAFEQSWIERKKVEMRFAHIKRIHKLDRLRLRGLTGAKDKVLLTALAQNLKRLAKLAWQPVQP